MAALAFLLAGCAGTPPPASSIAAPPTTPTTPAPSAIASVAPTPTPARTAAPTPIPTLASTTEAADSAPAGAIVVKMAAIDGKPKFVPEQLTATAGTVVFYLENVPGVIAAPDHNMRIGPTVGQVLAATPFIHANDHAVFTVHGLQPGTYVYSCSVLAIDRTTHFSNGMIGTLTVTP